MPSELERRLEDALARPAPGAAATARAERAALDALPEAIAPGRIGRPMLLLAAAVAVLVTAGATLAATGTPIPLVQRSSPPKPAARTPARPGYTLLPAGAVVTVAANGRATLVTGRGERSLGAGRLTTFAASPSALYLALGRPGQLRAVARAAGRVAWTHRVHGSPVAAAWAPFPIRIAYVLRTGGRYEVRDIWGTGTHDYVVDRRAAPVTPTWRWDSKAFAYVTAAGAVVVHDAIGGVDRRIDPRCRVGRPSAVAFAPAGDLLAVAGASGRVAIVDTASSAHPRCAVIARGRPHIAWLGGHTLLAGAGHTLTRVDTARGASAPVSTGTRSVTGLAVSPDRSRIVLALTGGHGTIVMATVPPGGSGGALRPGPVLLRAPHAPATLEWR